MVIYRKNERLLIIGLSDEIMFDQSRDYMIVIDIIVASAHVQKRVIVVIHPCRGKKMRCNTV
jgi:hypothetical protein